MFSSGPNYTKLKTHLRLAINRLKLLEKKKTELTQKARKEIADYIAAGKVERAKIRVEHIIREDYMVEAFELLEMYCDLLLARFGLIQQMKTIDNGLAEAISTIIWAAPRVQADVQEMKIISDILFAKYGKQYADACREEQLQTISEKVKHKMSIQYPSKLLVEKYMIEIAKNYSVEYTPDPQVMAEGKDTLLIDIGETNDLDQASGGPPQPPGFIGYPQAPQPPHHFPLSDGTSVGFVSSSQSLSNEKDLNNKFSPASFSFNIPLGGENVENVDSQLRELPPPYTSQDTSFPPDLNKESNQSPKPQPRSKMPDFQLPDLPAVPTNDSNVNGEGEDIDFDDLMKRFENLKKKK